MVDKNEDTQCSSPGVPICSDVQIVGYQCYWNVPWKWACDDILILIYIVTNYIYLQKNDISWLTVAPLATYTKR